MVTSRIVIDPRIMMGKPVIRGTRITVEILLKKLSEGLSQEEIMKEYPRLKAADIKAALGYAASTIQNEEIHFVSKR
jgi:uncharacterized protein (DUF433 family)